jgi:DNA-binding Lrp family transcriptional regulator
MGQHEVLMYLTEQEPNKRRTQREIADALHLSVSTVNEQLRALEATQKIASIGKSKNKRYIVAPEAARVLAEGLGQLKAQNDRQEAIIRSLEKKTTEQAQQVGKLSQMIDDILSGRVKFRGPLRDGREVNAMFGEELKRQTEELQKLKETARENEQEMAEIRRLMKEMAAGRAKWEPPLE